VVVGGGGWGWFFLVVGIACLSLSFRVGWVGVCLFFENCTVDASIFKSLILVFKFLRALGGCLGIRSR
jgi:hypothetical protein